MSEWKEYKLGEVVSIASGFAYKGEYIGKGDGLLLGMGCVSYKEKFLMSGARPYLGDCAERYYANAGDIVLATRQQSDNLPILGMPAIIPNELKDKKLIVGANLYRVTNNSDFDNKYIYWLLKTPAYVKHIASCKTGTTVGMITKADIENFVFIAPDKSKRKQILETIGSLDDKIDLLHRENATLEQMAETLFRQWFVVEAKEEWEEGSVVDLAKHCKDSINPQKHPNTVFEHYSIPAFDDGKKPTAETGENIQSNKYLVPTNCILFSKLNPHKDKRVWLMLDDVPDNAICSTEFQIVKPSYPEYLYFLYGWLTNKENYDEIASGVGGTSGSHQRIDPKSIFSFSCPNVDIETIRNYNNKVEPLFYKIRNNQKQIQTLIQTRDGLLPRLMSGEVKL